MGCELLDFFTKDVAIITAYALRNYRFADINN